MITIKNIILVLVSAIIVVSIWYLEAHKPPATAAEDIVVVQSGQKNSGTATATSTGNTAEPKDRSAILAEKAKKYPHAKEITDPTGFVNTAPFKLSDYAGKKVILLDFWTYSCINCQRTIPYLNAWYEKYKDKGLVIVGVHTPEFDFEKEYANVAKAAKDLGITYPVVLDSNQGTWSAYHNQYWPREYLIDIDGYVVHDHIGEGGYSETEQEIQKALTERNDVLGISQVIDRVTTVPQHVITMDTKGVQSPETYFGSERNQYLGNGTVGVAGSQTLEIPEATGSNTLYLGGSWDFQNQFAETKSNTARIVYRYSAKNVYFVASSAQGVKIKVLRDGKPLGAEAGKDVAPDGTVLIKDNRLYNLVQGADYGEHTLEIEVLAPGLDAYTFTFG